MLSDGTLVDTSSRCDSRGLTGADLARCKQLLSAVPGKLHEPEQGPADAAVPEPVGEPGERRRTSRAARRTTARSRPTATRSSGRRRSSATAACRASTPPNTHFRFHTYFSQQVDVSFEDGDRRRGTGSPIRCSRSRSLFYFPIITDPVTSGTMFAGLTTSGARWTTAARGPTSTRNCNEFTGAFAPGRRAVTGCRSAHR